MQQRLRQLQLQAEAVQQQIQQVQQQRQAAAAAAAAAAAQAQQQQPGGGGAAAGAGEGGGGGGGALVQTPYGLMKVQMVGQGSKEAASLPVVGSMNINIDPSRLLGPMQGPPPGAVVARAPVPVAGPPPGATVIMLPPGMPPHIAQQMFAHVPTAQQMMAAAERNVNPLDTRLWSPVENARFEQALAMHGEGAVSAIAAHVGTKSRIHIKARLRRLQEARRKEAVKAAKAHGVPAAPAPGPASGEGQAPAAGAAGGMG
jgi:hypothetical protein